jgi:hypothetical protein
MKDNSGVQGHCWNNGIWYCCEPAMILVSIIATVCSNNQWFPLLQQCVTKMTPGHVGCLVPRRNTTDMDGPIKCSSLTLECEEHLKKVDTYYHWSNCLWYRFMLLVYLRFQVLFGVLHFYAFFAWCAWNECQKGWSCLSVCMIQIENCWTDLDEIWYGRRAIGDYPEVVLLNFIQSIIPTWQMNKFVMCDQH